MTRCQVKIVLLKEKGMKKIEAIIRKTKFEEVKAALLSSDIDWFEYHDVHGIGQSRQERIYLKNDIYSWIEKHVAAHDGDGDTLDHVGAVLYTTIDSLLTALSDAVNVMVLKPVDVGW